MPNSTQVGRKSASMSRAEQVVVGLVHHRSVPFPVTAQFVGLADPGCAPFARAPVRDAAQADQVVEGLAGLGQRRFRVETVAVEDVDVAQVQAFQARFDGVEQVLAAQAPVGDVVGHGPERLGGHDVLGAAALGQNLSQERLGLACLVHVGRVEGVDAQGECLLDDLHGGVEFHLVSEREPGTVGDFADLQSGLAEASVLHGRKDMRCGASRERMGVALLRAIHERTRAISRRDIPPPARIRCLLRDAGRSGIPCSDFVGSIRNLCCAGFVQYGYAIRIQEEPGMAKYLIIGGVAGGASAARASASTGRKGRDRHGRARRLRELRQLPDFRTTRVDPSRIAKSSS